MKLSKIKDFPLNYLILGVVIGLIITVYLYLIAPSGKEVPRVRTITSEEEKQTFKVEIVIDGDTLKLEDGRLVRLIGIDTPETRHPEVPVQVFGEEASQFARQLCEGFDIYLEYDQEPKDVYGRTLAYVYLKDGRMLNEELIKQGYAYVLRRFPFRKKQRFLNLQEQARFGNRGLWSLNLSYGRLSDIALKFDQLSEEGKREFDRMLDDLIERYPKNRKEFFDE
jgi:micrococcal nuclease